MAGDGPSHLPLHYGTNTSSGEVIQRPLSPLDLVTPNRAYQPVNRLTFPSEERTPVEPYHPSDDTFRTGDFRRRPSNAPQSFRRHSLGEYDGERPSFNSEAESRRTLRPRDDNFFRDDDRGYYSRRDDHRGSSHPDAYERSKPPRSFRNYESYDKVPFTAARASFDDSRLDNRDLENGRRDVSPERRRRPEDNTSISGYNYEGNKYPYRKKQFNFEDLTPQERAEVLRLPWVQWMNSDVKNHFVAAIGEFVGTTMFLFFAFAGTQVANIQSEASDNSTSGGATGFNVNVQLYIAVVFGFSLMVNVWIFFRISGGLFNPAVTLGMVLVGALPITRAVILFIAQILGSIAASAIVLGLFPTQFNVRTTLAGGTSIVSGIFIEAILTAELVFTIFMLAKEKHKATFIAPVGIGLALFIAELVGVYYTGGSLNPARSFGPCVVTVTFDKEHWIYWVGPIIGSLIAVFFYKFIKMLEYEMANPGQDGDGLNDPTKNPDKRAELIQARIERSKSR